MKFIKTLLLKLGIDKTVFYTVFSRGWQGITAFLTVGIIAFFLTSEEQGYYFTFSSLLAVQVFVELGLSYVLQQFAGHEKAHLEWTKTGKLLGNEKAKERLASLLKLTMKWYVVAALLILVFLLPIGYWFFSYNQSKNINSVVWRLPWLFLVITFSLQFILTPILSILEGCGKIQNVAKVRLAQDSLGNFLLWIGFSCHFGLYAAPLLNLGRFIISASWLSTGWRKNFFSDILTLLKSNIANQVDWRKEIFPFQWKIAVSWLSGYFIFQLFNPVLFAYHGAKVAGQMGLTLTVTNGIVTIAMAWINTKIPKFCEFIVKENYKNLDNLFFTTLWQSLFAVLVFASSFISTVFFVQYKGYEVGERFLPIIPLFFLFGNIIMNHVIFAMAVYLRAHKQEPLLLNSVVIAVLMSCSTYFFGKFYGALGVTSGYFAITLVSLCWCLSLFFIKRREWHG